MSGHTLFGEGWMSLESRIRTGGGLERHLVLAAAAGVLRLSKK